MSNPKAIERLRPQVFGAIALICVQSGIGMFVNLFVTIPRHHSGANPANYFGGSMRSVAWAIDHGAIALAIHVDIGVPERLLLDRDKVAWVVTSLVGSSAGRSAAGA